jgi:hypothetical protein
MPPRPGRWAEIGGPGELPDERACDRVAGRRRRAGAARRRDRPGHPRAGPQAAPSDRARTSLRVADVAAPGLGDREGGRGGAGAGGSGRPHEAAAGRDANSLSEAAVGGGARSASDDAAGPDANSPSEAAVGRAAGGAALSPSDDAAGGGACSTADDAASRAAGGAALSACDDAAGRGWAAPDRGPEDRGTS